MASKHTPGPWQPHVGCNGDVSTMDGYAIAECCLKYSSIDWNSQLANTRLIAAAPDLLAALNRLSFAAMARDNTMGDQCALFAAQAELRDANILARAAIVKAIGEAQ